MRKEKEKNTMSKYHTRSLENERKELKFYLFLKLKTAEKS